MLGMMVVLLVGGAPAGAAPEALAADEAAAGRSFRPRLLLQVRVDAPGLPAGSRLKTLETEVAAAWRPYLDVEFAWPGDLVARGLDDRLELVITDRLPPSGDPRALGWIDFPSAGRPARTIHASLPAARALSDTVRWPTPTGLVPASVREQFVLRALGLSIAHELGHYLLQSTAHAEHGLMRSHFSAADVAGHRPEHLALQPGDTATLRLRLLQYARAIAAPEEERH
jgi:hypothetical protein